MVLALILTSKVCLNTPLLQLLHTTTNKAILASCLVHRPYRRLALIFMVRLAVWLLPLTTQTLDLLTSCLDNPHSPWDIVRAHPNTRTATMHDELMSF